ncbi:hypothetical protein [Alteromonas gilva]|uniref:Cadherin domain-containing protein n=1 Tax=Alteromonas gilva TaxID=2987522 RepID=A0ABT5L3J1_9ALTE|nr:hypothetical protein [Alteromonas gilva]MDC8831071.1 hypothetical protein [Alteromonas gilva]
MKHKHLILASALSVLTVSCGGSSKDSTEPAPNFDSEPVGSVFENLKETSYIASAVSQDNSSISYRLLDSPDSDLFIIDGVNGLLTFKVAPDFETPLDSDSNNFYEVVIEARSSTNTVAQQTVVIEVLDDSQIDFSLSYPSPEANVGGTEAATLVRGYVYDEEDGELLSTDIASITVNGVQASVDINAEGDWSVELPIDVMSERIDVNISLNLQNDQQIEKDFALNNAENVFFTGVNAVALDEPNSRFFAVDNTRDMIFSVDLATGTRKIVSDWQQSISFEEGLSSIAYHGLNDTIFVATSLAGEGSTIVSVDTTNGQRELLTNDGLSHIAVNPVDDVHVSEITDMVIDVENNRLLALELFCHGYKLCSDYYVSLLSIDINTGELSVLSRAHRWEDDSELNIGVGKYFEPVDMKFDSANGRIISATQIGALVGIDIATGDTTTLSNYDQYSFPVTTDWRPLSNSGVLADNSVSFVSSSEQLEAISVESVNLATGERTWLSEIPVESYTERKREDIIVHDNGSRLLVFGDNNTKKQSILAVDLNDSSKNVIAEAKTTLNLENFAAGYDQSNDSIILGFSEIGPVSFSANNGSTTELPVNTAGFQAQISTLRSSFIDDENQVIYLSSGYSDDMSISKLNLSNTELYAISNAQLGDGPLVDAKNITLDASNNRLLATNNGQLFEIDLVTGDRANINLSGYNLSSISHIALQNGGELVYIADYQLKAIFEANLTTGVMRLVANTDVGTGPKLNASVIALDNTSNDLIALDNDSQALLYIDIETGDRTVISGPSRGTGPKMQGAIAFSLDSERERAFVLDEIENVLFIVDLSTGDRAIATTL